MATAVNMCARQLTKISRISHSVLFNNHIRTTATNGPARRITVQMNPDPDFMASESSLDELLRRKPDRPQRERRYPEYLRDYVLALPEPGAGASVIGDEDARSRYSDRASAASTSLSEGQIARIKQLRAARRLDEVKKQHHERMLQDEMRDRFEECSKEKQKLETKLEQARELRNIESELHEATVISDMINENESLAQGSANVTGHSVHPEAVVPTVTCMPNVSSNHELPAHSICSTSVTYHSSGSVPFMPPSILDPTRQMRTLKPQTQVSMTTETKVSSEPLNPIPSVIPPSKPSVSRQDLNPVCEPFIPFLPGDDPPVSCNHATSMVHAHHHEPIMQQPVTNSSIYELLLPAYGVPKPTLPTFASGKEKDFALLKMALENILDVHTHLTEQYKYNILLDRLGGNPLKLARSFAHDTKPYSAALQALKETYGQTHNLARSEIRHILSLPFIRPGDYEGFDNFALNVQSLVSLLQSTDGNESYELRTSSHVDKLLEKLPGGLRDNFIEYCLNRGVIEEDRTYNLLHFNTWLKVKSRARRISSQAVSMRKEFNFPSFKQSKQSTSVLSTTTSKPGNVYTAYCAYCNSKDHHISRCEQFVKMSTSDATKWIRDHRRCMQCGRNHRRENCNLQKLCSTCKGKHLTILHEVNQNTATRSVPSFYIDNPNNVMLKIVPITLHGSRDIQTYALLDDGSMRSIILSSAVKDLGLITESDSIMLTTVKSDPFPSEGQKVNVCISSPFDPSVKFEISNAFSAEGLKLSSYSYPVSFLQETHAHLKNLPLPDIQNAEPLLLIGSDHADLLLPLEPVTSGLPGTPIAVRTKLGWTLQGPCSEVSSQRQHCFTTETVDLPAQITSDVERLWKIDVLPYSSKQVTRSKLDKFALQTLEEKTTKVTVEGETHYVTPLLRKPDSKPFHSTQESVMDKLKRTEKRLSKDAKAASIHQEKIQELVAKGYVKLITEEEAFSTPESWFIPHHVIPQHGKYRLVFDCSYEFQKRCLNKELLPGPILGSSLLGVFLRFRQNNIAVSGDIKAMFHQVRLRPEDRCLLRFIWHEEDAELSTYEWQVLPFGTTCSPCCATFALHKLASEIEVDFPDISKAIHESFYVDNCLCGFDTPEEAKTFIERLRQVLFTGGFNIRQWSSNDPFVLRDLPTDAKSENCELWLTYGNSDPQEGTLGLLWNCQRDVIAYKLRNVSYDTLTLNVVYRVLASQYDPLGYLAPFLGRAKVIVQNLWNQKPQWGKPIPQSDLLKDWEEWESELKDMNNVTLPRCLQPGGAKGNLQLHIFCDASEKLYGSVAYLRSETPDGCISVTFVAARSRVAPRKTISVPRLELLAAVTGAQLVDTLTIELTLPISKVILWSDSTTVLSWLKSDSCRYKVFVGTRVAEIQSLTDYHSWRYIPTTENPADDLTRGKRLTDLSTNSRWKNGPIFLIKPDSEWPDLCPQTMEANDPGECEIRKTFCGITGVQILDPSKYQTWDSLLNASSQNLKDANGAASVDVASIEAAEYHLFSKVQEECFSEELNALRTGKKIPTGSRLSQLSPEYDETNGVIRVGGRLRKCHDLPEDVKHPIVLDPRHHITQLLIRKYDHNLLHYGAERLHAEIRRRFWILRGREAIKKHQRQCTDCQKWRATPEIPRMADLPEARLRLYKPPFYSTGMDCFGPMFIKIGRRREKRYGIIYKCLTTRAIYLDILDSMDAEAFLMSLRRFIARRGCPHELLSDCGTNFKGGESELAQAFQQMNPELKQRLAKQQISFQYNPPSAPHFGGSWEREIRTVKHGLRSVVGTEPISEAVLRTVMCEVESIMNSKPLGYVSSDISDVDPVTPNTLLLGRSDPAIPQVVYSNDDRLSRKRFRQSQAIADHFWRRYVKEYLPNLQPRVKWTNEKDNLCVNDIVLIIDPLHIRSDWNIGTVTEVFGGSDGRVRSAKVTYGGKETLRPVSKLIKMPKID